MNFVAVRAMCSLSSASCLLKSYFEFVKLPEIKLPPFRSSILEPCFDLSITHIQTIRENGSFR